MMNDLEEAGVPEDVAKDLRKQTDAYFGKLYEAARTNLTAADLESLFGDWKPTP